jgi:hypothetical protein
MSLAAPTKTPVRQPPADEAFGSRLFQPAGSTLEDLVLGAWEDLLAGNSAECPVCRGRMRMAGGCESCGSDLS